MLPTFYIIEIVPKYDIVAKSCHIDTVFKLKTFSIVLLQRATFVSLQDVKQGFFSNYIHAEWP